MKMELFQLFLDNTDKVLLGVGLTVSFIFTVFITYYLISRLIFKVKNYRADLSEPKLY